MKRSEASYTVEAAFLVPIILAVIIALIQICLVSHDRVIVREALEYAALKKIESEEYFLQKEELAGRLLLSEVLDIGISSSNQEAEAFVLLRSRRIVPLYFRGGDGFTRKYAAKRRKMYPQEKTMVSEIVTDAFRSLGKGREQR